MEKEIQRKYLQLQLTKQQLTALIQEKNAIDERVAEMTVTINALNGFGAVKPGNEMWSPLGSGAFVISGIKDTENVLVSVGAGVVVKETKERAIELLNSRLEEIMKFDKEIVTEINRFSGQMEKIEEEMQKLAEKEKGEHDEHIHR